MIDSVAAAGGETAAPALDCRTCGACCQEGGVVPVYYGDGDETTPIHLTRSVRGMMGFGSWETDEGTRCMRTDADGRCVALRGEIGARVACASYGRRPKACREFDPGSEGCLEARKAFAALPVKHSSGSSLMRARRSSIMRPSNSWVGQGPLSTRRDEWARNDRSI